MRKRICLAFVPLTALAGCGGGGAVNSVGTTPATTTTTTTTTTTPTAPVVAINYDDAEYARSNAASAASAISAYNAGSTGTGVKIAILDSGLTDPGTEFSGRIDRASRSLVDNNGYADDDGHGTAVAAVAAAAHNGNDIEGLAFGATILALKTDSTGSCGTTDGCKFNTGTLATAIDYARVNGAKIINLSLGGSSADANFRAAISRATAAGIIIVIAAGNDATAQPDPLAQVAGNSAANGLVVIAGASDSAGNLASFSGRAGDFAAWYIAALGSRVRSFDKTGTDFFYSGTSFSAPAVAGAIALLESAFPNLTPAQVLNLLYSTATDAGAAGTDSVYGHGLLNLAKAFQPAGATSLAGSAVPVSLTDNGALSAAMGDATASSAGQTIILDSYGRAFALDLGGTLRRQSGRRPLGTALNGDMLTRDGTMGAATVSLTVARNPGGQPWAGFAQRGLTHDPDQQSRPVAGTMIARINAHTEIGLQYAGSGHQLGTRLGDDDGGGSYLAAKGPGDDPGFDARGGFAFGLRWRAGRLAITTTAEQGRLAALRSETDVAPLYTMAALHAERRFGRLALRIGGGLLDEQASVLGARFSPALGGGGATTTMLDLGSTLALGGGWSAEAAWRHGWTRAVTGGLLARGRLQSDAAAFSLSHAMRTQRFGLRFALPTRVSSGGLTLSSPSGYDYTTGVTSYAVSRLGLSPQGRERALEASYGLRVGDGWLDANLFVRRDPGNIAAAPDDHGTALRYALTF